MCTVKKNNKQDRFLKLANLGQNIFHIDDLARIWNIQNKNNLHTTLKRYTQNGLLKRIYRGLYTIDDFFNLDPFVLGIKAIHSYAYISTETVLALNGIIQQDLNYITLISGTSRRFSIVSYNYYSRQLKDDFLFNDLEIIKKKNFNIASTERAVADLLYFNPHFYFDNQNLIDWDKVKKIQKNIGYDFIK